MESRTTVVIPFDDRVIFVGSLHCTEFSSRLSEVAQTLNPITRIQLLISGAGRVQRWVLGAIGVGNCSWVCQRRFGSFIQFADRVIADMGHGSFFLSTGQNNAKRCDCCFASILTA